MTRKLDKVEVVTVGVGWSGGIVAAELSKAGHKVVGLERGQGRVTEDFTNKHDELRYSLQKELMVDTSDSTLTFRNTVDETAKPLRELTQISVGTGVGGGGIHWAAQTHRYFPYDFEIRTKTIERYGEAKIPDYSPLQDWGITYDELEPYYDKFEKTMGISGEENELEPKRSNPYPTPPMMKTNLMKKFEESVSNLGYSPYVIPTGNVSEEYVNPDGQQLNACQYNGFCSNYACEYGARATPIVTVVPTAKETGNFELVTHANVTRVLHKDGKATGVLYVNTLTGEEIEQPADLVVLAGYTISNIRLLLLSDIGEQYNPKTKKGVIGKNMTDTHNYFGATGFFDEKYNRYIGAGALGMTFGDFNADNFDHTDLDYIHGGQVEIREVGYMAIAENPVPVNTPAWGREFKKQSLYYANRQLGLRSQHASIPHHENYFDLDPKYIDKYGDPILRLTYDYTDNERALNQLMVDKAVEVLEEMGAHDIYPSQPPEHYSAGFTGEHTAGGVIMGENPENSAVNNYLQMWDMENLFVCGASAFPHSGPTNPTLTLGALTYRATEGMIKYLEDSEKGMLVEVKSNKMLL